MVILRTSCPSLLRMDYIAMWHTIQQTLYVSKLYAFHYICSVHELYVYGNYLAILLQNLVAGL